MAVGDHLIHIVSSFESVDYLTTFSHGGELVWEVPFQSQVVSWGLREGALFVFSKARDGQIYFLTDLDAETGQVLWEKNIFAPKSNP